MTTIRTRYIVPVDLNAILCAVEFTLAKLSRDVMGDITTAEYFNTKATERRQDIDEFFWDEEFGLWLDYDLEEEVWRKTYYASSFFPLWLYTINSTQKNTHMATKAYHKMNELGVLKYVGGIPTSLINSGQQWDFPNCWPPLQHIAVHGLTEVNLVDDNEAGKKEARNVAQKFLESAFLTWKNTGNMYEKYDVTERSKAGHGGEYEVQEGFGWTNGVVLNFLHLYGDSLEAPEDH